MIGFGLYALTDDRVALTIDNVEQVLGSGIKPGFVVWFFMATILIGLFMNLATARARRTIREAAELEAENVHIREEQARRVISPQIKGRVEIVRHYGDIPLVHCRPHEVSQVLMTILVNAFEAMKVNVESSVGKGTRFHLELPPSRAGGEKPA